MNYEDLLNELNSFDPSKRKYALEILVKEHKPAIQHPENINMHVHSFFSYNAEDWSPSRIAWEYQKAGLFAAGIIDFDVIDGMNEFLEAGEILGLRTSVGIETRAFSTEMADKEIDSPGEPGVSYIAAAGFSKQLQEGSEEKAVLNHYSKTSDERNIALIDRINPKVSEISIDYKADVLPLTPSGNATERHIIRAYVNKSWEVFDNEKLIKFWSNTLQTSTDEAQMLINDRPKMENTVRSKFAKKGGFGYVQPTSETFPKVEDFFAWVRSCEAIPMESWLDGTSTGESDPDVLLELAISNGAEALNIIPDRNWNIKDPETKALKVANLKKIVETAGNLNLPIHIGTEMNKKGLPFFDDLAGPVLGEFKNTFLNGAKVFVGHTIASRFAGFSYTGDKAANIFSDKAEKNNFFESIGALPAVNMIVANELKDAGAEQSWNIINDSVKKGSWTIKSSLVNG